MSGEDLELRFGADASGAVKGGAEAAGAVKTVEASVQGLVDLLLVLGGAATSSFRQIRTGAGEAAEKVKGAAESVIALREAVSGIGEVLIAAFAIEQIAHFVEGLAEASEKALHTAQTFGLTVGEVQRLGAEATLAGVPIDAVTTAMQRLDKAFATAKQGGTQQANAFRQVGIDLQGAYTQTQLMTAALEGLSGMAGGPAKVAAAMAMFGRNIQQIGPLLGMTKEQIEENARAVDLYGAANEGATAKGVALAEALNTNKVAGMGLRLVLTDALAPAMTEIVQGLNTLIRGFVTSYNEGGTAKIVMEGLAITLKVLATGIEITAIALNELIRLMAGVVVGAGLLAAEIKDVLAGAFFIVLDAASAFVGVLADLASGDMGAAGAHVKQGLDQIRGHFHDAHVAMAKDARVGGHLLGENLRDGIKEGIGAWRFTEDMWKGAKGAPLPKEGFGTTADDAGPKAKPGPLGESDLQMWEAELQDKKLAAHDFWNDDLAGEITFWQEKLAILQAQTGGTKAELNRRAAEIRQVRQKIFDDEKALANQARNIELTALSDGVRAQVDAEVAKAQVVREGIQDRINAIQQASRRGEIDPRQELDELEALNAEAVANEQARANAVYEITLQGLHDKEALYAQDPLNLKRTQQQEALLAAQHQTELTTIEARGARDRHKIEENAATETQRIWRGRVAPIVQSFGAGLQGMLDRTTTFQQALLNVVVSIENAFFNAVERIVSNWIAGEITKTAMSESHSAIRKAAAAIEALFGIGTQKGAAIANVGASAAQAGAAGVASAAAIPLIGWEIAPAAGAADFAAAMAFAPAIAAAGGFDIPSGLNPIVQAHQEEMILPARIANPLRNMIAANGDRPAAANDSSRGGRPGMPAMHFHLPQGMTRADAERHAGVFVDVLRDAVRKDPKLRRMLANG